MLNTPQNFNLTFNNNNSLRVNNLQDLNSNSNLISGSLINVRSLRRKTSFVYDHVSTYKPSFFALTEIWLRNTPDFSSIAAQCCPDDFTFLQKSREGNIRGGGVALICNINLKL